MRKRFVKKTIGRGTLEGEKTRKRRWGEGGDWVRGWRKEEAKGKG